MKLRTLLRCSATSGCTSSVQHTSAATLKDVLRHRDITLCVPSVDGRHRLTFCSSQHLLTECIRRHDLLVATQCHLPFLELLGTSLSFTNLLAAQHEGEERIDVQLTADEATIFVAATVSARGHAQGSGEELQHSCRTNTHGGGECR